MECIPQNDNQERHRMINQMHQVYANASITIIDASGGDAQSGLPGVSSLARRMQECVHVRNTAILELPCGAHELNDSKWATRGWTYQEGYFSPRRLVFTRSQVLFLCNEQYEEESISRLLQQDSSEHPHGRDRFRHLTPDYSSLEQSNLLVQLEEYSKRDLTYERDSLNAFLGVLNFQTHETRNLESKILHVSWGLIARKSRVTGDLSVYLDWYHKAPAERRPDFPSWAWTGWGGPLEFENEGITLRKHRNYLRPRPNLEWDMCWESKDGTAVTTFAFDNDSWSTSYTDERQLDQQPIYPNRLKVTCLIVPIRIQVAPFTAAKRKTEIHFENEAGTVRVQRVDLPEENMAVVQFCQGIYIAAPRYLDQDLDVGDDVIGLIFAKEDDYWGINFGCLLARQLEEGTYERVGAVPDLMAYPLYRFRHHNSCLSRLTFLDEAGSILDKVRDTARQMELPFDCVGERRTVVLV